MSKSVEELFKDAPEGATHWDASNSRVNSFMKLEGDTWFYWPPASTDPSWNEWGKSGSQDASCMIPRPKPKPWSGPEDGLPPVGLEVDFDHQGHPQGSGKVLFYGNEFCIVQNTSEGKPYEQVALIEDYSFQCRHKGGSVLDERETAIREIESVLESNKTVHASDGARKSYAETIYDAGFKREVV